MRHVHDHRVRPRFVYSQGVSRTHERQRPEEDAVRSQTLPPQHSLGCHAFPRNTHCGDTISLRNKYFVVDKVSYRFKLEYGKYKRDDTRLYVQEATRYLLNKHLDALLCGDDAVKNLMSGDGDAQTFGEKENDERDTNEKDDKMT